MVQTNLPQCENINAPIMNYHSVVINNIFMVELH